MTVVDLYSIRLALYPPSEGNKTPIRTSKQQMADRCGVDVETYDKWERGKTPIPRWQEGNINALIEEAKGV